MMGGCWGRWRGAGGLASPSATGVTGQITDDSDANKQQLAARDQVVHAFDELHVSTARGLTRPQAFTVGVMSLCGHLGATGA